MKEYKITFTCGSLSGGGDNTRITRTSFAENEDHVKRQFYQREENQMYGRKIIDIEEVT